MPAVRLSKSLTDDLAVVSAIGPEHLQSIVRAIGSIPLTIRRSDLKKIIADEVDPDAAETLERFLFQIALVTRRGGATVASFFGRIDEGLTRLKWSQEQIAQWEAARPALERLLNIPSVRLTAKAIDLSYDFARLCVATRILTDIRPIFGEEDGKKTEIEGATITQTLRIDYGSQIEDDRTISVALDLDDIKQLKLACEEAIDKAEKSKRLIEESCGKPTIMPGEEAQW